MSFDLHTHTTCSDGSFTPEELIDLAIKNGLQGLSITDHDSISAYPETLNMAKTKGIILIPGVEFSCHYKDKSVHILGYSFNFTNSELLALCQRHKERRTSRNLKILEKLKACNIEITEEELNTSTSGVVGRPHIAKLIVEKKHASDIAEAFRIYLGDGKKGYVSGEVFTIEETLQALHAAGGLAVLAHPHLYYNHQFVREVMKHPFDGIESEYAQMPPDKNAPWIAYAKEHHLLMTGGSDFHGSIKPQLPLGATQVSLEQIKPLLTQFYSHYPEYRL